MKDTPLISVLIPAYNHEKYVKEAIYSIINQTYNNIELIIINDGSTDNTWEKILSLKDECEKKLTNFICINQPNHGVSYTLNKLASLAQGTYIYIMASDDNAEPNALKILSDEAIKYNYVLTVGDNAIIDSDSNIVGWDSKRNIVNLNTAKYKTFASFLAQDHSVVKDFRADNFGSYETLLKGNYIPNGYLINKEAYNKAGGYPRIKLLEDYYLNLQLSKLGKFKYIDKVLFRYRWHSDNSIKKKKKMLNLELVTYEIERQRIENTRFEKIFYSSTLIYSKSITFFKSIRFIKNKYRFGKEYLLLFFNKKILLYKNYR